MGKPKSKKAPPSPNLSSNKILFSSDTNGKSLGPYQKEIDVSSLVNSKSDGFALEGQGIFASTQVRERGRESRKGKKGSAGERGSDRESRREAAAEASEAKVKAKRAQEKVDKLRAFSKPPPTPMGKTKVPSDPNRRPTDDPFSLTSLPSSLHQPSQWEDKPNNLCCKNLGIGTTKEEVRALFEERGLRVENVVMAKEMSGEFASD